MTGMLDQDDRYLLTKFYLQILADVTNEDIVRDPEGYIRPGELHRIPFRLSEADISTDVLLLHPAPRLIDFAVETPGGTVISPGDLGTGGVHVEREEITYYRLTLPLLLDEDPFHTGQWHALLKVDEKAYRRYLEQLDYEAQAREIAAHGVRYAVNVHAYSNLRMRAWLDQASFEPQAKLTIRARLTEYDLPVARRAGVVAEGTRPDGSQHTLQLDEVEPGVFEGISTAALPGIHTFRLLASGSTLPGQPFTREKLLTGAVWRGGDDPGLLRPTPDGDGLQAWCDALRCLATSDTIARYLDERGIDREELLRCFNKLCE